MATGQKPLQKFSAGSVSCAVWPNQAMVNGKATTIVKATIERRYKDSTGEWKSTGSFSRNEIPLAMFVLAKAFEFMCSKPSDEESTEELVF